jgi:hypothetical protein
MGHHFVPQFYLRGFEADGGIWVHDFQRRISFASQVKTIANETKLYSEELETRLAEQIEDPANSALLKLRTREAITVEEKLALARYIIVLWKRVPKARQRALDRLPQVADEVQTELEAELDALSLAEPAKKAHYEKLKVQAAEAIAQHKANPAADLWHGSIESQNGFKLDQALLSMNWVFLYTEKMQFLTSDNPVFFFEFEGISKPTSELTFPVSSNVCLWATRTEAPSGRFLQASTAAIKEINRRTAQSSHRWVYSKSNEKWVLPFVLKKDWPLSRLSLAGP